MLLPTTSASSTPLLNVILLNMVFPLVIMGRTFLRMFGPCDVVWRLVVRRLDRANVKFPSGVRSRVAEEVRAGHRDRRHAAGVDSFLATRARGTRNVIDRRRGPLERVVAKVDVG